jgi:SAM-dependent MidA family methyltransferase
MANKIELPSPAEDALAHSRAMSAVIRERIAEAGGWIGFSEYMNLALYSPGLGYYSAGAEKFGQTGDFVTAPEISPLFGRCIARSLAGLIQASDSGAVLELGAGTGSMAAEILRALERIDSLPFRYQILEISADLRARQQSTIHERIPSQAHRVEWLNELPENGITGVILANEVLDALPVTRFDVDQGGLRELGVSVAGDSFGWRPYPASDGVRDRVSEIENALGAPLPAGYASEYCPSLPAFVDRLSRSLDRGLMLLIDYGLPRREYYHRDRSSGTLSCHYRHRVHADPFFYPGLQDITAWVDFTAVAEAADAAGMQIMGYTNQANYLLAAGAEQELAAATETAGAEVDLRTRLQMSSQLQTLMMPGQMGERFKVMGLCRELDRVPPGFSGRDFRHLL